MNTGVEINTVAYVPGVAPRSRMHVVQALVGALPRNQYGLPAFIYRPDLIPDDFDTLNPQERDHVLHIATFPLTYAEGFPAMSDGTPFWGQLPFEDDTSYGVFRKYLDLVDTYGVRRIDLLDDLTRDTLIECHIYNCWPLRARARDLFEIAAAQKMRERRIMKTTDKHFLQAEGLLGKVLDWFNRVDDDGNPMWHDGLTGRSAMEMLEKLVKIQRVSIGLSATGGAADSQDDPNTRNASVDTILREVAQKSGDIRQDTQKTGLEMLLQNPEMAMAAQELILKVNSNGKERTITAITDSPTSIADEIG